jgi:GntR family transcriptional repressor for pyruvate dehydrogenase complex
MKSVASPQRTDRGRLVQEAARQLRDLVFASAPDARIGSLPELAQSLGVGIVTVQQVARILEHEGLLEVRRGPGGGYYGRRPDALALERSIGAFMRMHPGSFGEALDITSLLFTELVAAAALCRKEKLHAALRALQGRIATCASEADVMRFESEMQDVLFRMVERPLFEVLTRVTLSFSGARLPVFPNDTAVQTWWRDGRQRIITAILSNDPELARFEADRSNRTMVLRHVKALREQANAKNAHAHSIGQGEK